MTTKFDNQTDAQIADLVGSLDAQTKAIEKRIKEAKEELAARGVKTADGELFSVTRSDCVRWTLDTAAAKEALGEDWVTKHSKITPVTSWRITVNHAALAERE